MATLTHRRHTALLTNNVALMAEGDANSSYGAYVWTVDEADLAEIPQALIDFAAAHYGIDAAEAESLVDPANIVVSAGAWDDPDFVEAWCATYAHWDVAGYRTQDGAVVLDNRILRPVL